jgi:electron transport complex protein RnfG
MSIWNNYVRPVAVLLAICLGVGLILSSINAITAPVIAQNEEESRNATYFAVLPEADSFTQLTCDIEGVTEVLEADNGAGYVICAQSRGYGGQVPAAVAISPQGVVLAVAFLDNDETPGLGQKVTGDSFSAQFSGLPAEEVTLEDIDAISGATISSKAALSAVNLAIQAYEALQEGGNP